jgi:hypothetical protein
MSTTTEHTPSGPCDKLLDYVYGELSAAESEEFKAHLPTCARCQAELAGFQRVRSAVKAAIPVVDPPVAATQGALHAQLLHAAAQRKPPGGKLLTFARKTRKVILSPGFAVAATFLVVGGFITVNMKSGKLEMPAPPATAPVTAPTPAPAAPAAAADEAEKIAEAPTAAEPKEALAKEAPKVTAKLKGKDIEAKLGAAEGDFARDKNTSYYLDTKADNKPMKVAKTEAALKRELAAPPEGNMTAPAKKALALDPAKPADSPANTIDALRNESMQKDRGSSTGADDFSYGSRSRKGGESNGAGGSGSVSGARPGRSAPSSWNAQVDSTITNQDGWDKRNAAGPRAAPQAAAPAAPPPPAATAPAPQAEMQQGMLSDGKASSRMQSQQAPALGGVRSTPQTKSPVVQSQMGQSAESLRKKAEELANAGRCEDAIRIYSEIERNYATAYTLPPKDKRLFDNCMRLTGRKQEQPADDLEQSKRGKKQDTQRRTLEEERAAEAPAAKPRPAPKPAEPPPQSIKEKKRAPSKRYDAENPYAAPESPAQAPAESKPSF